MKINLKIFNLILVCLVTLSVGCGGGGGGGGGSSSGNLSNASTGVRVLHASIDTAPLDLYLPSSSEGVARTFEFASPIGYAKASNGTQPITVTEAMNLSGAIVNYSAEIAKGSLFSILVYGEEGKGTRSTTLIQDSIPELGKTDAAIKVVHGSFGAAAVSLSLSGVEVAQAPYGNGSNYVVTPAGAVAVTVNRVVDSKNLFSGTLTLEPKRAYTILMAGDINDFSKAVLYLDR